MPGFGHGPFGQNSFGEWEWSEQVLYDQLPELQKNTDQTQGNLALYTFVQGLRPSFDKLRHLIRDYDNLRDPLKVRTAYDDATTLRLGQVVVLPGTLDQLGTVGKIDGFQDFV